MSTTTPRRADAQRNRERLLATARTTLREAPDATLERIARDAGVGIGTLYRHFPTREALIAAVYDTELQAVLDAAAPLLDAGSGAEALRAWLDRYADFSAAKRGMAEALRSEAPAIAAVGTRRRVNEVIERLLRAGADDGTLRADIEPDDFTTALVGVFLAGGASSPERLARLLDLLVGGARSAH